MTARSRVSASLALVLVACGSSRPAVEAEPPARLDVRVPTFEALDADGDGRLDEVELVRAALPYHAAWDLDQDGFVTVTELARGMFGMLDRDGDDRISRAELAVHARMILPPSARELARWDDDRDGFVDRLELREGLERLGVLRAYDASGSETISDLELTDAMLRQLDADEDGFVDADEWRAAGGR